MRRLCRRRIRRPPVGAGNGDRFDAYESAGSLSVALLQDFMSAWPGMRAWFPALPSVEETGAKRGVVIETSIGPRRWPRWSR